MGCRGRPAAWPCRAGGSFSVTGTGSSGDGRRRGTAAPAVHLTAPAPVLPGSRPGPDRRNWIGGAVPPAGKALDILELVVLVRRRDERRAGDRPCAGRPGLAHTSLVQSRRPEGRPGENEWPVLLPAALRGKTRPAPTPNAPAQPAHGAPTSWTPASCSLTR